MDLVIIIPSEENQTKEILYDITYMWNLKKLIQRNLFTKQKQTHRHRKQAFGCQRGEKGRVKFGV